MSRDLADRFDRDLSAPPHVRERAEELRKKGAAMAVDWEAAYETYREQANKPPEDRQFEKTPEMTDSKLTPTDIELIQNDITGEYPDETLIAANPNLGYIEQALSPEVFGQKRTLHERAVALLRFLVETHPFPDGNKRTALNAVGVYYGLHGTHLDIDNDVRSLLKELGDDAPMDDETVESYLTSHLTEKDDVATFVTDLDTISTDDKQALARLYRDSHREIFDKLAHE